MDIIRHNNKKFHHTTKNSKNAFIYDQKNEIEMLDEYINRTRIVDKNPKRFQRFSYGKIIFWCAFFVFFASGTWSVCTLYSKADHALEKITDNRSKPSVFTTLANIANPRSYTQLHGFDDGRINILLLGRANSHKSGKDLTDTIMVASVNTKDHTVGLFSLPRDLLVSSGDHYVKINALYQTGLRQQKGANIIIDTVEKVTGQKIHYYVVMDFEGFIDIINTLDGINVNVPHNIRDTRYPGPGYSYETFEVFAGLQKFDGETALKYARTRHDAEGDFGRAKRQQQIMQAARNKAFSLETVVHPNRISDILTTLGDHVHTNITPHEIEPFISLVKKVDTHNITNIVVDAWKPGSLLVSARYYSAHGGISGLVPRIGSYKEIHERVNDIFDLEKIAQREKDIAHEKPTTITLINRTDDTTVAQRVKDTLTMIGFENITIAKISSQKNDIQQQTNILDQSKGNKPFSLDELIKKIPATRTESDLDDTYDTDFVIVLGNDIVQTYNYTAISQDELENDNTYNSDK
jgi:LCP family protein required for cell wall assembly